MLWNRLLKPRPRRTTRWRLYLDPLEERTLLSLTTFAVDDTQSSLALSGNAGGVALQEQMPGSLLTAYTGSFLADVDFSKGLITFVNGDPGITAENSGDWQPLADGSAGAEPANYGGQINLLGTAVVAIRNVDVRPTSDPLPLNPLGDGVSYGVPNDQHLKIHGGRAAYNHPLLGHGTKGLGKFAADNQADMDGHSSYLYDFNGDGSSLELSLAIDFTVTARIHRFPITFNLDGVITAYGSLGVVGPSTAHAGKDGRAVLGTALVAGAHAHDQALLSSPRGNLDNSRASGIQRTPIANTPTAMPGGGFDGATSQVSHGVRVDQVDAAFVELSSIERLTV